MKRQPRLNRSEVVARLRTLAARHGGAVSPGLLATHDSLVLRSLRMHFPSFALACRAARVAVAEPPPRRRSNLRQRSPRAIWSRRQVVDQPSRLGGAGASNRW